MSCSRGCRSGRCASGEKGSEGEEGEEREGGTERPEGEEGDEGEEECGPALPNRNLHPSPRLSCHRPPPSYPARSVGHLFPPAGRARDFPRPRAPAGPPISRQRPPPSFPAIFFRPIFPQTYPAIFSRQFFPPPASQVGLETSHDRVLRLGRTAGAGRLPRKKKKPKPGLIKIESKLTVGFQPVTSGANPPCLPARSRPQHGGSRAFNKEGFPLTTN